MLKRFPADLFSKHHLNNEAPHIQSIWNGFNRYSFICGWYAMNTSEMCSFYRFCTWYDPLLTISWSVDRSLGAMMLTRGRQDPLNPTDPTPLWTVQVTLHLQPATLEVVSTQTHEQIPACTIFVHLNCQIVNIRLGVFVYSPYLKWSVYTQFVCQCVCLRPLHSVTPG